jgi:acetyl-CoA C-acetyltransferase
MTSELREGRGRTGLVTGNGWYLTKHSSTLLSSTPPSEALEPAGTAALPKDMRTEPVSLVAEAEGRGSVETYTVLYGKEGPERGIVLGRLEDGQRFLANTPVDRELLEAFAAEEAIGRTGSVRFENDRNWFDPS